jgi:hypothetical protein
MKSKEKDPEKRRKAGRGEVKQRMRGRWSEQQTLLISVGNGGVEAA